MHRSPRAACVLTLAVTLAMSACGSDGDSGSATTTSTTTTSTTTTSTTSTLESAPSTGAGPSDGGPSTVSTTAPGRDDAPDTTSPNLAPTDSPLVDQLLDPTAVGGGYTPDDTLGDGTFDGDLCEDVVIEPTWEDEAGQGLSRSEGDGGPTFFTQAVLDFAEPDTAEAFVVAVRNGQSTCLGAQPAALDIGDEAFLIGVSDEEGTLGAGVVRVGARVTTLNAQGPADPGPVDEDLVRAAAAALGG